MLRLTQISLTKQLVYSLFMLCIHCKFLAKKKNRGKKEKKKENFLWLLLIVQEHLNTIKYFRGQISWKDDLLGHMYLHISALSEVKG